MKPATSGIYECEVMHCRQKPRQKSFTYRVFMLDVDLDAFPKVTGLGHNHFNLFSIDDEDHIDLGLQGGIRANLLEWLSRQGREITPDARIRLITFPRVFGYGFNPVSFYYLSKSCGEPLFAVAEVVNTFREMKLFIIDGMSGDGGFQRALPKNFYVSPFSDPGDVFDFRLGPHGGHWKVNIDDIKDGEKILISSVRGEARELTSLRLLWYAFKYPLLSLKIIGLIHWHAMLLWMRRVPYFRKSGRRDVQLDVLRPHSSLKQDSP
jgi:DUF1365 family protein